MLHCRQTQRDSRTYMCLLNAREALECVLLTGWLYNISFVCSFKARGFPLTFSVSEHKNKTLWINTPAQCRENWLHYIMPHLRGTQTCFSYSCTVSQRHMTLDLLYMIYCFKSIVFRHHIMRFCFCIDAILIQLLWTILSWGFS